MTYEEIKDAARWVEQREDPSMSDDPFVWQNAVPTLWDNSTGTERGNPGIIKVVLNTGAMHIL